MLSDPLSNPSRCADLRQIERQGAFRCLNCGGVEKREQNIEFDGSGWCWNGNRIKTSARGGRCVPDGRLRFVAGAEASPGKTGSRSLRYSLLALTTSLTAPSWVSNAIIPSPTFKLSR
jgi:hypothetical protein